jgi:hypothetical protein
MEHIFQKPNRVRIVKNPALATSVTPPLIDDFEPILIGPPPPNRHVDANLTHVFPSPMYPVLNHRNPTYPAAMYPNQIHSLLFHVRIVLKSSKAIS